MYNKTDWQNLPNQTTPVIANSLNKMENGTADSYNSIGANAYDNTRTYNIGAYCIYNNTLYRCNTVISTAEDFNSSHWDAVTILQGIADTGWRTLSLESGITQYSNADKYKCRYRRIGKHVFVVGCVKGISAQSTTVATLPAGYRSSNTYRYITGRNQSGNAILSMDTDGTIKFEMYTTGNVSSTDYIYIQTDFFID